MVIFTSLISLMILSHNSFLSIRMKATASYYNRWGGRGLCFEGKLHILEFQVRTNSVGFHPTENVAQILSFFSIKTKISDWKKTLKKLFSTIIFVFDLEFKILQVSKQGTVWNFYFFLFSPWDTILIFSNTLRYNCTLLCNWGFENIRNTVIS